MTRPETARPRPRVFVARRIPEVGMRSLEAACDVDCWEGDLPPAPSEIRRRIRDCDGLLSLLTDVVDAEVLDAAARLRVVSNFAVGYDNIDVKAATARGVKVGNTPGVLTEATADCALALMLAASRRIVEGDRYARDGRWKTWEPIGHIGQDVVGGTVGVFGMGRIGFAFAKRCRFGFDMNVIFTARRETEWTARAVAELGGQRVEFDELLARSDFLSLHASMNPESRRVFDRNAFAKMKPTAVFVNTARGGLVDETALAEALATGRIFAAGLDVTDPEPPHLDNPLLKLPNVAIAPHLASATVRTRNRMAELAAENLLAGLFDRPMPSCVNLTELNAR
jgi:glyoxylate reductase